MADTAQKVDDYTIRVTKTSPVPAPVEQDYDLRFLLAQKERITADLAAYTKIRQAELDEVNALLAKCDELGVKEKVILPPAEPDPIGDIEPK